MTSATKETLRDLIGRDELEETTSQLLAVADRAGLPDLRSEVIIISGRLEEWKKGRLRGDQSDERLTELRNGIRSALLTLAESLPETMAADTKALRLAGMPETRFKAIIFWMMLAGNAAAFVCLFVLGSGSGAFTPSETATTCALLLSPLAAYFSVMFSEVIERRSGEPLSGAVANKRVNSRFQIVSLLVLSAYFFLVCFLMLYRSQVDFSEFTKWLAVLEGGLGIFVAQVVHALFKTGK